jgi:hypothetical protein
MATPVVTSDQEAFQERREKYYWKQDICGSTAKLVELLKPIGERDIGL